jgi:hypothetical protein
MFGIIRWTTATAHVHNPAGGVDNRRSPVDERRPNVDARTNARDPNI